MANQEYQIPYTQQQVAASMGREPIIQNRTWHIWDVASMQYVDTGTIAEGTDGSAAESAQKAILAESWAVGGTGTRQGEDTNNAKYWAEHINIASSILYENDASGMTAENVQDALDELSATKIDNNATIPIANGGTGATTAAQARANLSVPSLIDGLISATELPTIPTSKGGTGATSVSAARTNLSIYSKAETDTKLATKLNTYGKGVNLLNNWDFRNPLNSRGSSSYYSATGFTFAIDTWTVSNGTTLSIINGGITLSATSGAAWNNIYAFQRVKGGLQPGTYTFSALFDNNVGTVYLSRQNIGTGQVATESSASSGIIKMTFTLTTALDGNGSYFRFHVSNSARFLAIKLELGEESTLAEQKDGTWVLADPQPNYAENVLRCSMNGEAGDTYGNFPFLHIASGSYVGTGTYGSSNPNNLTFSFVPKIIWCSRTAEKFAADDNSAIKTLYIPLLSTEYQKYAGFCESAKADTWGKKSADGKTIQWYSTSVTNQLNISGISYYYTAIG